ncbi:hypothetical protein FIBSPDRAFT_856057 [Athelia psychrophila]|uniref:Uncharacterized protein n=1 Tax=Athelia psychrophila TaxID=1759441 RepID=A0A166NLA8_9AGAM|nr:hypothetical protein FIBSPDRAFT_856057 [Fibularhizoctonia sp. CBS 109695]
MWTYEGPVWELVVFTVVGLVGIFAVLAVAWNLKVRSRSRAGETPEDIMWTTRLTNLSRRRDAVLDDGPNEHPPTGASRTRASAAEGSPWTREHDRRHDLDMWATGPGAHPHIPFV